MNGLVALVAGQAQYSPAEDELMVAALQTLAVQMQDSNKAAVDAANAYNSAIAARNKILYAAVVGLVDVALEVKKYVISMTKEGTRSDYYKQISKLEFIRLSKRKSAKKKTPPAAPVA